jgi:hypothetical protein
MSRMRYWSRRQPEWRAAAIREDWRQFRRSYAQLPATTVANVLSGYLDRQDEALQSPIGRDGYGIPIAYIQTVISQLRAVLFGQGVTE